MRQKVARTLAALSALALLAAPTMSAAQSPPADGWTYAYENGIAAATHRDDEGKITWTLTCAPPTGDIILTDHTFDRRQLRNVTQATLAIGFMSITIPATEVRPDRRTRVLQVNMPQRPPILAAVQEQDRLTVVVNNVTHDYGRSGAQRLKEIAYACWGGLG